MKYNVRIYEDSQGMLMINVPDEIFLVIDLLLSDVQEDTEESQDRLKESQTLKEEMLAQLLADLKGQDN